MLCLAPCSTGWRCGRDDMLLLMLFKHQQEQLFACRVVDSISECLGSRCGIYRMLNQRPESAQCVGCLISCYCTLVCENLYRFLGNRTLNFFTLNSNQPRAAPDKSQCATRLPRKSSHMQGANGPRDLMNTEAECAQGILLEAFGTLLFSPKKINKGATSQK